MVSRRDRFGVLLAKKPSRGKLIRTSDFGRLYQSSRNDQLRSVGRMEAKLSIGFPPFSHF